MKYYVCMHITFFRIVISETSDLIIASASVFVLLVHEPS